MPGRPPVIDGAGSSAPDPWARWVLDRRYGGDPDEERESTAFLAGIRDRVLDGAALSEGETLLDVGTGDGLIAFGALDRVGPSGRVVFTDISSNLLDFCRRLAAEGGVTDRCTFVRTPAQDLGPIESGSVDAVTTRSVLIYVADKAAAFAEFHRVLKPGGRLSIFEPINRYFGSRRDRLLGVDVTGVEELADRLVALYDRLQPADTDPMLNFGERDLVDVAEAAGFERIHLELHVDVEPGHEAASWTSFFEAPPNPLVPSIAEASSQVMSPAELERFVSRVRPLIESGQGVERSAMAYLRATKPPA